MFLTPFLWAIDIEIDAFTDAITLVPEKIHMEVEGNQSPDSLA